MMIDNSATEPELIAENWQSEKQDLHNLDKWRIINKIVGHETDRNKKYYFEGGELAIERLLSRKRKDNCFVVVSEKGKVVRQNAKDLK